MLVYLVHISVNRSGEIDCLDNILEAGFYTSVAIKARRVL